MRHQEHTFFNPTQAAVVSGLGVGEGRRSEDMHFIGNRGVIKKVSSSSPLLSNFQTLRGGSSRYHAPTMS